MNNIISKISEIESSAASIMDAASERKKEYTKEMEKKTADFDKEKEAETDEKLNKLREAMEAEMKKQLDAQRRDAREAIQHMEENYRRLHTQYVDQLFQSMTKE